MQVFSINDPIFQEYGQVLSIYDFSTLLEKLKALPSPRCGFIYDASVPALNQCAVQRKIQLHGFGGMPIQIGYVAGYNKILNCLEYHKSSEFNIALEDTILVLGKQSEIREGKFDTALCKAFLLPAGMGVELFATTLHYAPMSIGEEGFHVVCVLPQGTNGPRPALTPETTEDQMCAGTNKWLLAHPESEDAKNGMYVGLTGENITFDLLQF